MEDCTYKKFGRCTNEKEKRERYLAAQHRYNVKRYKCIECDKEFSLANRSAHLKSKNHLKNKDNYIS